jgi:predicted dehydrogenase
MMKQGLSCRPGLWRNVHVPHCSFYRNKKLIDEGELGKLVRVTWILTDWFRTQAYYDNGGWRATWRGEGGGVLLNQCPHNLDLYQWFFGMPQRVTGFASIGKYHNIEVEDEVTGYFEYENGMIGHFITTTAESPGPTAWDRRRAG